MLAPRTFKILLITTLSTAIAPLSWAGSYRPGNPYQSTPVQDPSLCEQQCRIDSACRGWNFVKVSPRQSSGVCELNSQSAAPIPSAVSLSGSGAVNGSSARLVSTGTRTMRVGMGNPEPQNTVTPTYSAPPAPQTQRPYTPANARTIPARMVETAGNRPKLRHTLDSATPLTRTTEPSPPMTARMLPQASPSMREATPQLKHVLETTAPTYPVGRQSQPQQASREISTPEPVRETQSYNTPPPQRAAPLESRSSLTPLTAPVRPNPDNLAGRNPVALSAAQAQASLFGSLYDDVNQPRALSEADVSDPDAPIATVATVPVQ